MAYEQVTTGCGVVAAVTVATVTIWRQRRLESTDVGAIAGAFLGGCNIPAAVFLCVYGFFPDEPEVLTKLRGYEKYVALSGVCLLFTAAVSLWTLLKRAWETEAETDMKDAAD